LIKPHFMMFLYQRLLLIIYLYWNSLALLDFTE